jgi:integrase
LKTKKLNNTITAHGFRSTFSQWAADRTNYQWEVREMVLAHSVGSNVERIYQRSDLFEKRRALMEEWGEFVTRPPAEVVSLRP